MNPLDQVRLLTGLPWECQLQTAADRPGFQPKFLYVSHSASIPFTPQTRQGCKLNRGCIAVTLATVVICDQLIVELSLARPRVLLVTPSFSFALMPRESRWLLGVSSLSPTKTLMLRHASPSQHATKSVLYCNHNSGILSSWPSPPRCPALLTTFSSITGARPNLRRHGHRTPPE